MDFFDQLTEALSLVRTDRQLQLLGIIVIYACMSVVTLIMYAFDKAEARKRAPRISERALLLCGLACGWPGAVLAQNWFRHKTIKTSFRLAFAVTVIFNCLVLVMFISWSLNLLN
ncbi:DUF1294 domain-containing protein [Undibacterium pigrum]|uniref:Uncharacterized membrane protein YsdA (DUF1294 family) n=1 Tax=Undibacterium pigrum TaxID=401470 RepID=A0A318JD17_9BURK|nr:DUF1294 domain-containing protein [Undibacterium pigrum]PXX47488.1 uncharacterized membrane protein YsdA (DUF1294 family) [Undibacterium pigrum]